MRIARSEEPVGMAAGRRAETFGEALANQTSSRRQVPAPSAPSAPSRLAAASRRARDGRQEPPAKNRVPEAQAAIAARAGRSEKPDASRGRRNDLLACAHGRSAEASRQRQAERREDALRNSLFREVERQLAAEAREPGASRPNALRPLVHCAKDRCPPPRDDVRELGAPPPIAQPAPESRPETTARAEAITVLVERIQTALKEGRPTLSLALGEKAAAGSVEVERCRRGEVSLRIRARGHARQHLLEAAGQLSKALAARGLRVRSLVIS